MNLFRQIKRIERIDQLVRLKATGTPKELAKRLGISERQLYRLIEDIKGIGAPIYYSSVRQSYCYEREVKFSFGFVLNTTDASKIKGGANIINYYDIISATDIKWQSGGVSLY